MQTAAKVVLVFFLFIINFIIYTNSIDSVIESHQFGVKGYEVVNIEARDDLSSRYEFVYYYTIHTDQTRSYNVFVDEVILNLATESVNDEYGLIATHSEVIKEKTIKDITVLVVEVRLTIQADASDEALLVARELQSINFNLAIRENKSS